MLSIWIKSGIKECPETASLTCSSSDLALEKETLEHYWYDWSGWYPKGDDVFGVVHHLALCDTGNNEKIIELLKTAGKDILDSVYGIRDKGKSSLLCCIDWEFTLSKSIAWSTSISECIFTY